MLKGIRLIKSKVKNKTISYVGYTVNINKRLLKHNTNRGAKFTKGKKWKLVYFKKYNTKIQAMKEEYKLKKDYKLRSILKNLN